MSERTAAKGKEVGSMPIRRLHLPMLAIRWRRLIGAAANRAADSLAATLGRATCTGCCAV